jgi:Dolichyl-phosphate-mannose-protein mannosyltransferase
VALWSRTQRPANAVSRRARKLKYSARVLGSPAPRALLVLTVAGLLVRVGFLLWEPATGPVADERMWVVWGADVLPSADVAFSPVRFRLIFHPPLYPYFVGVVATLSGGSLTAVKLVQAALGALLVPALGRLGGRVFGPPAGLAAATMAAFYPELVWFSAHFWAETLFAVILWWGFERLVAADDVHAGVKTAVAAGVLWGFAILTRETALYFVPFAAAWLAWRRPPGIKRAVAFAATVLAVVLPWTYRNWVAYGAFVPVSTAGALNLWQGNTRLSRPEVYEQYWAVHGRIEKYRFARQKGLEAIAERQPTWLFEKLAVELPSFWEADSQPLVHIRRGAYGSLSPRAGLAATVVVLLPYLLVLVSFVAGLAALPTARAPLLLVAFLLYYVLLHVATHGYARYRLPVLPVLFLVAGWALAAGRQRLGRALSPRRKVLAAAVALSFLFSLVPSLRLLADHRAYGLPDPGDRAAEEDPDR